MKEVVYFVILLCAVHAQAKSLPCTIDATYQVMLNCNWTKEAHPTDFPTRNPHFSPLCGTVHNENYTIWTIGGIATPGVRELAEFGSCATLDIEIDACEEEGHCDKDGYFSWDCQSEGDLKSVCAFSGNLTVSNRFRYISMMTMLAPSPDWNVGLDAINLCRKDKKNETEFWMEEFPPKDSLDVFVFDAGTNGGVTFQGPVVSLDPFVPITFFDALNVSNIFYNAADEKLYPLCQAKLSLLE